LEDPTAQRETTCADKTNLRKAAIKVAIESNSRLKTRPAQFALFLMPKILLSLSVLFLTLSAVFGVLNTSKARTLREVSERNVAAREQAEVARVAKEKEIQKREKEITAKNAETESKVAAAEADLVKSQSEKAELLAKVQANDAQIAELQKRIDETAPKELMPDALPMPGAGDLQAQLEDTRRQLDNAEREKALLSEKVRKAESGPAGVEGPRRRVAGPKNPGLRGTVLAVNQAYNFVVLNLGGRQGVEPNSEMLVLRGGTPIGRIRVSSVEPATAIGDIISNSLARGVQVQPGDIVIYAGTTS
jgi:hypothetical protein